MLKIELKKIKIDNLLMKDIKGFYIHVQTYHNSPIKKRYAGCTVFPGIDPHPGRLTLKTKKVESASRNRTPEELKLELIQVNLLLSP